MKARWRIIFCAIPLLALTAGTALAQSHGHGKGEKDGNDHGRESHARFDDRDREVMHRWSAEHAHGEGLPPGLSKRDQLPPGLERQLVVRGELPPGLRKRIRPCPQDLERRLPPPPPGYQRVAIGGHIVLLNRRTYVVQDIFNVELR